MTGVASPPVSGLLTAVDREVRRARVAAMSGPEALNGIDRVEVLSNLPGRPGHLPGVPVRRTLLVWLIRGPVPAGLGPNQIAVSGGVRVDPRVNPVGVVWAYPADQLVGGAVTEEDRRLVDRAVPDPHDRARVQVVRTSSAGDWSSYLLTLLGPPGSAVPPGFDPPLARAPFAFTVDCPSDLDCRQPPAGVAAEALSPVLDYLARDYSALRGQLLDRLATLLPNWTDRGPADPMVTLAELFAALGDRLASWQDAVAAEAYLGTARRRTSVRRHARLLDYRMHEGCAARTWLAFGVPDDGPAEVPLAARVAVADMLPTGGRSGQALDSTATEVLEAGGTVFQTCAETVLHRARNRLPLHSWGNPEHVLAAGATSAFVAYPQGQPDPKLRAGDVLILTPETGDPSRRHPIRLVRDPVAHDDALAEPRAVVLELHWSSADALPWPLVVARRGADGRARPLAVALANVVLADHGVTLTEEPLLPAEVPVDPDYRPRLGRGALVWSQAADPQVSSAAAALAPDPRRAEPALTLNDGLRTWSPRPDLLASDRGAAHFVVEPEPDGRCRLRFGNGQSGRRPDPGTSFTSTARFGEMAQGNVAADTLASLLDSALVSAHPGLTVTNPVAARGGTAAELISQARELAPRASRTQLRAVTSADYAEAAMAHPAVQRAAARRRWTGSWYVQQVAVDLAAEHADDPNVRGEIARYLHSRRCSGVDVELVEPVYVPLEIVLRAHLTPGSLRSDAAVLLRLAFLAGTRPDGRRGFFHPDNFTFGQPMLLSEVVAAAMVVPGVDWVEVGDEPGDPAGLRFRRLGRPPAEGEVAAGRVSVGAREVLRADSDPSCPENGRLACQLRGGA